MTAGIYVRYSPGADREKSSTVEAQIEMCRQKARSEQIEVDEHHIYVDQSISGASIGNRPAFQRMLNAIESNTFPNVLITKDTSRLFRNEQEAGIYEAWIWTQGVEIRYVIGQSGNPNEDDSIWFSGRIGHMVAEYNRRHNARVTYAHQQMNAKKGFSNGGEAPFGYLNQKELITDGYGVEKYKTRFKVDIERAPAVEMAFEMYLAGNSIKEIVTRLNELNYRTRKGKPIGRQAVKNWFNHPDVYSGSIVWNKRKWVKDKEGKRKRSEPIPRENWVITPDSHQGLITKAQADAAYKKSSRTIQKTKYSTYLLTGLLVCNDCGCNLQMKNNKQTGLAYYVCSRRRDSTEKCINANHYRKELVEGLVMDDVATAILEEGFLEEYYQKCQSEMQRVQKQTENKRIELEKQIKLQETRIEDLYNLYLDSRVDQERTLKKMAKEQQVMDDLKEELEQFEDVEVSLPVNLKSFREELAKSLAMDINIQKIALKALIKKIRIYRQGKVELHYHFDCDGNGSTPTSQHTP